MTTKIRLEQMEAFDEARIPGFDDYVVNHFESFSPIHAKTLGESGIRQLAREGLARAREYGFTKTGSVGLFVDMLILLGIKFDTDPQYPWAGQLLNDRSSKDELQRADQLWKKLMEFLRATRGVNQELVASALRQAKGVSIEGVLVSPGGDHDNLVKLLTKAYPEKFKIVGAEAVQQLFNASDKRAGEFGIDSDKGMCLFSIMAFAMGHGFAEDPKFPWVSEALASQEDEPTKTIEKLTKKLKVYLNDVLANLESNRMN